MRRIYLIDLDDVVVEVGTHTLLPNALRQLQIMGKEGELWAFSCWAFSQADIDFLLSMPVKWDGFLHKPYGDEYVMIDDKLKVNLCDVKL